MASPLNPGAAAALVTGTTPGDRPLHDTHCHIDLFADPSAVVREADLARVYTIAVTTIPSCFAETERLVGGSRYVRAAIGLHPELIAERAHELPLFLQLLSRTRYVGEVGLDYTTSDHEIRRTQRLVLSEILAACDAAGDKILTVHSRRAAEDVVDAFGVNFRGRYILHWYSGGQRTLQRALVNGAFVSVNLAMLRSARGRAIVAAVPRDRVLIESDGPFVATSPEVGKTSVPSRPVDAYIVLRRLSALWGIEEVDGANVLHENFRRLLEA